MSVTKVVVASIWEFTDPYDVMSSFNTTTVGKSRAGHYDMENKHFVIDCGILETMKVARAFMQVLQAYITKERDKAEANEDQAELPKVLPMPRTRDRMHDPDETWRNVAKMEAKQIRGQESSPLISRCIGYRVINCTMKSAQKAFSTQVLLELGRVTGCTIELDLMDMELLIDGNTKEDVELAERKIGVIEESYHARCQPQIFDFFEDEGETKYKFRFIRPRNVIDFPLATSNRRFFRSYYELGMVVWEDESRQHRTARKDLTLLEVDENWNQLWPVKIDFIFGDETNSPENWEIGEDNQQARNANTYGNLSLRGIGRTTQWTQDVAERPIDPFTEGPSLENDIKPKEKPYKRARRVMKGLKSTGDGADADKPRFSSAGHKMPPIAPPVQITIDRPPAEVKYTNRAGLKIDSRPLAAHIRKAQLVDVAEEIPVRAGVSAWQNAAKTISRDDRTRVLKHVSTREEMPHVCQIEGTTDAVGTAEKIEQYSHKQGPEDNKNNKQESTSHVHDPPIDIFNLPLEEDDAHEISAPISSANLNEELQARSEKETRRKYETTILKGSSKLLSNAVQKRKILVEKAVALIMNSANLAYGTAVALEFAFGRLYVQAAGVPQEFLIPRHGPAASFPAEEWPNIFRTKKASKGAATQFSPRLGTSWVDAEFILNIKVSAGTNMFAVEPKKRRVYFEIHCRDQKAGVDIVIDIDSEGSTLIKGPAQTLGDVNFHYPKRSWDGSLTVTEQTTVATGEGSPAKELLDGIYIRSPEECHEPVLYARQARWCEIRSVVLKYETEHRTAISDIRLRLTQVQQLEMETASNVGFRAYALPYKELEEENKVWWEAKLISKAANKKLKQNKKLEIGERAAWNIDFAGQIAGDMVEIATECITRMDNVGFAPHMVGPSGGSTSQSQRHIKQADVEGGEYMDLSFDTSPRKRRGQRSTNEFW